MKWFKRKDIECVTKYKAIEEDGYFVFNIKAGKLTIVNRSEKKAWQFQLPVVDYAEDKIW